MDDEHHLEMGIGFEEVNMLIDIHLHHGHILQIQHWDLVNIHVIQQMDMLGMEVLVDVRQIIIEFEMGV